MKIEIIETIPREGVVDVIIENEKGVEETFTYNNEMFESGEWKKNLKKRIKNRNINKLEKEKTNKEKGKIEI